MILKASKAILLATFLAVIIAWRFVVAIFGLMVFLPIWTLEYFMGRSK